MIATVTLLFAGFAALIWNSYRRARRSAEAGEPFVAAGGKIRWEQK